VCPTESQVAKPLLGSGAAVVTSLTARHTAARIAAVVRAGPRAEVPACLVDLVRLRSGALPDDVAVVVAVGE
jgi:hypothetical protein